MQVQPRPLGYLKATKLTNEELGQIAGGTEKLSVQTTQKGTGTPPGPLDVELEQIWD